MRASLTATAIGLTLATISALPGQAQMSQAELDAAIRDYLLRNPEVIVEALDVLETRQIQQRISSLGQDLANDPADLVLGNPDGDVTIVEFFDYRCPWCQRAHAVIEQVLSEDPNVRLVMKQFPVLGPDSVKAAQLVIAARRQSEEKYMAMHLAMLDAGGKMPEAQVIELAKDVGLDIDQLRQDAQSRDVARFINKSYQMAKVLGFEGTPAFVIGEQLSPGFLDHANLTRQIAEARAHQSN